MKKITINTQDPIVQRVAKRLDERSVVGLEKYKKSLKDDNRTTIAWLTMLQEELLDAANYVEKLKDIQGECCKCTCTTEEAVAPFECEEAPYFEMIERLAREKGIVLPDDYMDWSWINLPDATYDLYETTWRRESSGEVGDITTDKIARVEVRGTEVNLVDALAGVPSKLDNKLDSYDPHVFFEGFSVHKNKLYINFGS